MVCCSELFIGLMSGTSLDGIDAALVRIEDRKTELIEAVFRPFDAELPAELLALNQTGHDELARAAIAGNILAQRYAATVSELLTKARTAPRDIIAIGCHGQTVRHRPDLGFTSQLGNPSLLAELTDITVVADFRSRDIAAGGQGAPLVPAFHAGAFRHLHLNRAIVNIGGISNLTWLPSSGTVIGFDCGPGNLLLDAWAQLHLGTPFDRDGAWAAQGTPILKMLDRMLSHPFFSLMPPKSTGRDMFHLDWLRSYLGTHHAPADVQATLLELSARAIADAVREHCRNADEIYLCGGGAHNSALRYRLSVHLPQIPLALTDQLGIGADWVEAAAFAWLAHQTWHRKAASLPDVTGSRGSRILGGVFHR